MNRLSVPFLVPALAGVLLLGGCGDSSGDDTATDSSSSTAAPSTTPTSSSTPTDGSTDASPSPTAATSSAAPALPSCDSVWVAGKQLPFSYQGCLDGDTTVKALKQPCEFGKPLIAFRNTFWATPRGPVHEVSTTLSKDAGWHRALVQCGG